MGVQCAPEGLCGNGSAGSDSSIHNSLDFPGLTSPRAQGPPGPPCPCRLGAAESLCLGTWASQGPLDLLTPELRTHILRHAPWSARATCRAFCCHIEAARTSLALRPPPPPPPPPSPPPVSAASAAPPPPWSTPQQLQALLARLPLLRSLSARVSQPSELPALALPPLTELHLDCQPSAPPVSDVSSLAACTALTSLSLISCRGLPSLPPLPALPSLATLRLDSSAALTDITRLAACRSLVRLDLRSCLSLADLTPLASCSLLATLDLAFCAAVTDLTPLASCGALAWVDLRACHGVRTVAPLTACAALDHVALTHCLEIRDVGCMVSCVALRTLHLPVGRFNPGVVHALHAACPNLRIYP